MRRPFAACALLALISAPLAAQTVPNVGNARAEYFGIVATAADRMARALERAVATGDSIQLVARFGADVVWTPSTGAPVRGPVAAAAAFRRARARLQDFRIELAELDASDRLAFVTGRFRYIVPTASGLRTETTTPFAAALYREREDDWRIRLLTGGDLPPTLGLRRQPADSVVVGGTTEFEVELRDGAGAPLPRSVIRIDVQSGGGRASPSDLVTDENGRAGTRFTLGPQAGPQEVRVLSGALPDEPLDVRVVGRVGPPASIVLTTDSTRRVLPGAPWPAPIRVRVADAFGNPVPNTEVAIAASGAGVLAEARVVTNASGLAEATLSTAAEPGEILVEARVGGVGAELALRTRPGLAARIELPTQGMELVERSNRETGARALDAAGRPTDDPALRFAVRNESVALVTDDARVVALAPGQTWLVARAGDVLDSLWVTVRAADGSAVRSSSRVLTGAAEAPVSLDLELLAPVDSLRMTALSAIVAIDSGAAIIEFAEPIEAVPGLKLAIGTDRQSVTITYAAPGTVRKPGEGVRGQLSLVRLMLRLGKAGARGAIRTSVSRIGVPLKAAPVPVPPAFVVPILVAGTRAPATPVPLPVPASAP